MMAQILAVFRSDGTMDMKPVGLFQDHDVDIVVGIETSGGFIKRYGVAVYGEKNPYVAYRAVEKQMAEWCSCVFVSMINNDLKGYGK